MKIAIYVYNQDMEALKTTADRLRRTGAMVNFMHLGFHETMKVDKVLTLAKYEQTVRNLFAETKIPVTLLDDAEIAANNTPDPVDEDEGLVIEVPMNPAVVDFAGPRDPVVEVAPEEPEVVVIAVGEPEPTPAPRAPRGRKS